MKIIILTLLILIGILIIFLGKINTQPIQSSFATINNRNFMIDVAKTDQEQEKGLSIYKSLPMEKGMVFPFKKVGYYAFWMKNMKFPIDIIYIRENKITDIYKNVPPPKSENDILPIIKPKLASDTVLEINAGLSDKYGFKIGDYVKINY